MKKILLVLFILLTALNISYSQDMNLPPPVDNEFLKACVGDWVSEPYEFYGMKWQDEISIKWILNNQFLEMRGISKTIDGSFSFNVMSIITTDKDGNFKSWGFDDWGITSAGSSTGKIEGMKLDLEGKSDWGSSKGTMTLEGNKMFQDFIFDTKDETGKTVSQSIKLVYNKK